MGWGGNGVGVSYWEAPVQEVSWDLCAWGKFDVVVVGDKGAKMVFSRLCVLFKTHSGLTRLQKFQGPRQVVANRSSLLVFGSILAMCHWPKLRSSGPFLVPLDRSHILAQIEWPEQRPT